jgi:LacI family transcriptional regulator
MDRVEEKIRDAFQIRKFDGIILTVPNERDPNMIRLLQQSELPYILLDREIDGITAPAVQTDFYDGIRQATDYLIRMGHRNIGFVSTASEIRPGRESIRAFMDTMKKYGCTIKPEWMKLGDFNVSFGLNSFIDLMNQEHVSAVIAGNHQLLMGCMEGVRQLQLSIPKDVSLIGFEDSDFARLMSPSLTVIKRPLLIMGQQIASMILEKMKIDKSGAEELIASVLVPTQLIERDSCAPPYGSNS